MIESLKHLTKPLTTTHPLGYIESDGTFYRCNFAQHDKLATWICEELEIYTNNPYEELQERGFVLVQDCYVTFRFVPKDREHWLPRNMTDEQIMTLLNIKGEKNCTNKAKQAIDELLKDNAKFEDISWLSYNTHKEQLYGSEN